MDQSNNIEAYRKMRKRKKRNKRLIAVAVIFVLLAAVFFIGTMVAKDDTKEEEPQQNETASVDTGIKANGFPVSLGGSETSAIVPCGKNLFLLTKNSLIAFNNAGKSVYTAHHGYSNPVMKASDKRVLTYDQGGYQFRVDSNRSLMGQKKLTEKITCAAVGNNGYVAVATQTERYSINLTIYDADLREVMSWSASDKIITSLDFSQNSSSCLVGAYSVENGAAGSKIIELAYKKEKPQQFESALLNGMVLSAVYQSGGRISVVTDQKFYSLDGNGTIKEEYEQTGGLKYFSVSKQDTAIFFEDISDARNTTIALYDEEGVLLASSSLEEQIADAYSDGERLYVLTDTALMVYDRTLKLMKTEQTTSNASRVIALDGKTYVLSASELQQFSATSKSK